MPASLQPAVFLDRDGVIIENRPDYVRCWDDVAFIPGAAQALARLHASACRVVIVSNQSAVGRGVVSLEAVNDINGRIQSVVESAGGRIDGIYICPHTPADDCDCRKPRPGLLLRAARELGIDLARSAMIGDALSDAQAGLAAGVLPLMVLTGLGALHAELLAANGLSHVETYPDLGAAVDAWLQRRSG